MANDQVQARNRRKAEIEAMLPAGFRLITGAASGRNKVLFCREGSNPQEAPGFYSVELAAKWLQEFIRVIPCPVCEEQLKRAKAMREAEGP